jgi:hypothetical protein
MISSVLWDATPCSLLKVNRRFRELNLLHLQGRRTSQARNQHEAGSNQSIIFQKTELFRCRQVYGTDSILFCLNHFIISAILKVSLAYMYHIILSILKSIYIVASSLQFHTVNQTSPHFGNIWFICAYTECRDSSVGRATDYGLDYHGSEFESR